MSIHVEELGIADSSREYWDEADRALESTLTCYREDHLETSEVYEILDDYFEDNYDGDTEFSDLRSEIEKEAFAVYNLIGLTDESMEPMDISQVLR